MNNQTDKESLVEEKAKIESELNRLGRKINENGDWIVTPDADVGTHADPLDNANMVEDYQEKIAVLQVLEERYAELEKQIDALGGKS